MVKNCFRLIIITTIQSILPIIALLISAPWLININLSKTWQESLNHLQPWSLGLHGLFYLGLISLWPRLITRLETQTQISPESLKIAMNLRWYLLAIFIFFDGLMFWKGL